MQPAFKTGVVTFILASSLTVLKAKVAGPQELSIAREHLGSVENKTATSAETTTAPEARNDTRSTDLAPDSGSVRGDSAASSKSASGWNTVYKLLYETFSYPEAKELDVLLPLPTSYLTVKSQGDQKDIQNQDRQQTSRQLTYRTVSGGKSGDNGGGKLPGRRQTGDDGDQGSSGSSSSGSSGESEQFEEEDDDEAEAAADVRSDAIPKSTVTPYSTPSPPKPHRRIERAASGSKLPPLSRPWQEHGRDFGLPVPEDRWLKHVSAKRREAQLIQRGLRDQLRARARQWRQKEGHRFHQRYVPVAEGAR